MLTHTELRGSLVFFIFGATSSVETPLTQPNPVINFGKQLKNVTPKIIQIWTVP